MRDDDSVERLRASTHRASDQFRFRGGEKESGNARTRWIEESEIKKRKKKEKDKRREREEEKEIKGK